MAKPPVVDFQNLHFNLKSLHLLPCLLRSNARSRRPQ
jgi:hypothetical protein